MQHLDEGTIHTWLDGELSATDAAEAERHIAECAECAAAVAEARGMIAGASRIVSALDVGLGAVAAVPGQAANPVVPRSAWRMLRLTPTRAALAASLLVAAGALLTVSHDVPKRMLDAPPVMSASPAVVSAPASDAPVGAMARQAPSLRTADSTVTIPAPAARAPRAEAARKAAESRPADARSTDSVGRATQPTANSSAGAPASEPKAVAVAPAAPLVQSTPVAPPSSGAAAADARREPQRAFLDSTAQKARAAFQSAAQSAQLTTTATGARGLDIAGCYQIKSDSAAVTQLLPDRFALERAPGSGVAASNVVRAVRPDGQKDTVVTGSNWIQLSNDKAQIRSTVGTKQQVVSLQLTSLGGVSGQAMTNVGPRVINVSRTVCRP